MSTNYEWKGASGDRLLKKNSTKPNLRMMSIAGMKQHEK